MRNKLGTFLMVLGALLIVAAVALFIWNQWENQRAKASVDSIMPLIAKHINDRTLPENTHESAVYPDPYDTEMTVVEIGGYGYIGYVSIPSVSLDLPVMSEWDETRLSIAPCRYSGSVKTDDIVIAAHNYRWHFQSLSDVKIGDAVIFVDMDGIVHEYGVVALDVLGSTDVEEMTSGEYDLTLFTCTYGGQNRITVRCDQVKE